MRANTWATFTDRRDAGRQLAARLGKYAGQNNVVVLGLPRGGVPVAYEVAKALGAKLDVFVVRKVGLPHQPELAMGAIASGGIRVINRNVVEPLGVSRDVFDTMAAAEEWELKRRERVYRAGRPFPELQGATVVLVDDGLATGSSMRAAVEAVRARKPARVVVAAPVMAAAARDALATVADECVAVTALEPLHGVGAWYDDFSQTGDCEVQMLLDLGEQRSCLHAGGSEIKAGGQGKAP
jgi:predicted phosphoribosyltransferase